MAERRGIAARMVTTRWIVRAPVPVFRAGFGFVFGGRLMLLEHRGRVSGKRRYTVLEVAEHESPTSIIVPSGSGRTRNGCRTSRPSRAAVSASDGGPGCRPGRPCSTPPRAG